MWNDAGFIEMIHNASVFEINELKFQAIKFSQWICCKTDIPTTQKKIHMKWKSSSDFIEIKISGKFQESLELQALKIGGQNKIVSPTFLTYKNGKWEKCI